ncbi:helix-turn-helix domain-containing protein [Geothrix sp. PMB-07]|uniref:winged helix-turn-helix transcriptional regulator n=1 Tax=Geothrix sp. PMB-07 TaxID=3068640 RepID=UPI00274112E2|nr:helix-turn-helix domain-containing protein [Geothrix sp. PMB-07]WLT30718.1 helix-turn-helix domain-containing protein [Geothrix sp. PMB-07]
MKTKPRTRCPIAHALDLFGDRWSLVLVRDMLMGKQRFGDFLASSEGITASVLTDRLTDLEEAGLVEKAPYQTNPVRFEYSLTPRGRDLLPVLQALCGWGNRHFPEVGKAPIRFMRMRP